MIISSSGIDYDDVCMSCYRNILMITIFQEGCIKDVTVSISSLQQVERQIPSSSLVICHSRKSSTRGIQAIHSTSSPAKISIGAQTASAGE